MIQNLKYILKLTSFRFWKTFMQLKYHFFDKIINFGIIHATNVNGPIKLKRFKIIIKIQSAINGSLL